MKYTYKLMGRVDDKQGLFSAGFHAPCQRLVWQWVDAEDDTSSRFPFRGALVREQTVEPTCACSMTGGPCQGPKSVRSHPPEEIYESRIWLPKLEDHHGLEVWVASEALSQSSV